MVQRQGNHAEASQEQSESWHSDYGNSLLQTAIACIVRPNLDFLSRAHCQVMGSHGFNNIRVAPQVVEAMRSGASPSEAAASVVQRMVHWYPGYVGALVAVNAQGMHAAAAHGWHFQYAVRSAQQEGVQVIDVQPLSLGRPKHSS